MIGSAPMKKITQVVAVMAALLLAGLSVLAEATCFQWLHLDSDHAPACCLTADGRMGHKLRTDCHESMRSESVASECNQSGCQMATVKIVAQVSTAKSKTDGAASSAQPVSPASGLMALLQERFPSGPSQVPAPPSLQNLKISLHRSNPNSRPGRI